MIDQTGGPYKKLTRNNRTNINKIIFNNSNFKAGLDKTSSLKHLAPIRLSPYRQLSLC